MKAKCKICRQPATKRRGLISLCSSIECEATLGLQLLAKNKEVKRKEVAKQDRARKESLKSRSEWLKETQRAFNLMIRWRDRVAGYPCISSGCPLDWNGNAVDAGHWLSTGASPQNRFNEDNCHAQSKHDNRYLSGNAALYRINLIDRIGLERVEAIEQNQSSPKWTIEDFKRMKAEYTRRTKEYQKQIDLP